MINGAMLRWYYDCQLLVLRADEFIGMLGVNVSVRFSGDMAMVVVVAPVWCLLANVIKQHMCCTTIILGISSTC